MRKRLLAALILLLLLPRAALGDGWIVEETPEDDDFSMQDILNAPKTSRNPNILTLSFVGDCSIGGKPDSRGKEGTYTAVVDEKGFDWPFSLVREYLEADDFSFANNEGVFTGGNRTQNKNTVLGALPEYARVYLHSGIDAVNTVNNHCLDYLDAGYTDTLQTLDGLGIRYFGSLYPDTKRQREQLGIFDVKGVRLGAAGFSYPQTADLPVIASRIRALRKAGCQLVIISLHWGREELTTPKAWQIDLARGIIDAGADVIWGHHPHILQQVQFYKGKPIFYSTGNFTFGAIKNLDPDTGIFQLRYDVRTLSLLNFTVIPCRTQGRGDFRPYVLTDEAEKRAMLKKLIYPRAVPGMQNLPSAFAETGSVDLTDGKLP